MTAPTVTSLLQGFFTERLVRQLQASPQTISAYRDTIKHLLMFATQTTKQAPATAKPRPRTGALMSALGQPYGTSRLPGWR